MLIIFGVILGIIIIVIGVFLISHCCLAAKGKTTRELLKGIKSDG